MMAIIADIAFICDRYLRLLIFVKTSSTSRGPELCPLSCNGLWKYSKILLKYHTLYTLGTLALNVRVLLALECWNIETPNYSNHNFAKLFSWQHSHKMTFRIKWICSIYKFRQNMTKSNIYKRVLYSKCILLIRSR